MRVFIVLALIAVSRADVGGYNYGTGIGGGAVGGSFPTGSISGGDALSYQSYGGGSVSVPGGGAAAANGGSVDYAPAAVAPVNTEFNKEFFTYSAPEADYEDDKHTGDLAASLKKNLRVIFIRAPENKGLENAALALAKQSGEQQTAIYVLTKQADISDLANKLQHLNKVSGSKPEVHFVKYRTAEDAANAQRTIQQEYERLGGNSQTHNGGIAPVLDFASKAPVAHAAAPLAYSAPVAAGGAAEIAETPSNSYIPPASSYSSNTGSVSAPSGTYLPIVKVK